MTIQNLFTSRDNNITGNVYVGQVDRLWYNPDTNAVYVSDGVTPGGIAVEFAGSGNGVPGGPANSVQYNAGSGDFGGSSNFTFNGSTLTVDNIAITDTANLGNFTITGQTMAGTVEGRDINYTTVGGNANINVLGGLKVYTANLELEPLFSVDTNGRTRILVADTSTFDPTFQVIGSADGSYVTPQFQGVMLHVTGQPSTPSRIYNDGASNYSVYIGRRYNGISAAPTGVLGGQIMTRFGAAPYTTDNSWANISTTRMDFVASEDQTTLTQGSRIEFYTTPDGTNTTRLVAKFEQEGIILTGNVLPTVNNLYQLGNSTNKWTSLYLGPSSLYMEDTVLGTDAELTVQNGTLFINGTQNIQIGNMQMTTSGISLVADASSENIQVGRNSDTGYMEVNMAGIEFRDGTQQTTAAIPVDEKGNALGVVPLNASTKIDPIYLPSGGTTFKGVWDAANNTPTLADGVGTAGDEWIVSVAGTQDLGSGNITFAVGDFALYNTDDVWVNIPVGTTGVASFNTRTGAVTLTSADVTTALGTGSIVNSKLQNSSWSLTTGQGIGLTGSGTVALGNSITLTNTGVTAAVGGTGVSVSAATGNVTFSIGQAVGTASSVQFATVSATATIQATGNITGGNLITAGRVISTGNIETSGQFKTPNTTINSGIVTTGNISATGNINGGNVTATTFTGNVVGNVTGTATTATNLTAATSILAGQLNIDPAAIGKNTDSVQTFTLTGLTTGHKVMVMPQAAIPYELVISAAWASATNTLSIQFQNLGGGVDPAAFNLAYFAWV